MIVARGRHVFVVLLMMFILHVVIEDVERDAEEVAGLRSLGRRPEPGSEGKMFVLKFGLGGAFMVLSIAFILSDLFFFVLVNGLIRKIERKSI